MITFTTTKCLFFHSPARFLSNQKKSNIQKKVIHYFIIFKENCVRFRGHQISIYSRWLGKNLLNVWMIYFHDATMLFVAYSSCHRPEKRRKRTHKSHIRIYTLLLSRICVRCAISFRLKYFIGFILMACFSRNCISQRKIKWANALVAR